MSGIEALPSMRLYEIWFEQKWGNTLSLRAGQLAADTEFINAKYTDVFTNASLGWPAITSVNLPSGGPSPLAALGARLRANLTDNCTVSAAIFDGNAAGPGLDDPQLRGNHGVNFCINDPLLVIGEVQYIWTAPIRTFASAGRRDTAGEPALHPCVRGRDRGSLGTGSKTPTAARSPKRCCRASFCESLQSVLIRACGQSATAPPPCCRAEIDGLSEKAITQPPTSLQNAKRRPSLASRLASFATSVS